MDVSHINTSVLKKLLSLSEKKEALLEQIALIDSELARVSIGAPAVAKGRPGRKPKAAAAKAAPSAPKAVKPARKAKSGKRGKLKGKILSLLEAAGESGARVKDIATKLGVDPQNIHVWFSTTGKKLAGITRVESGHYKLALPGAEAIGVPAIEVDVKPAAAAKKKAPAKRTAKRARKAKAPSSAKPAKSKGGRPKKSA